MVEATVGTYTVYRQAGVSHAASSDVPRLLTSLQFTNHVVVRVLTCGRQSSPTNAADS